MTIINSLTNTQTTPYSFFFFRFYLLVFHNHVKESLQCIFSAKIFEPVKLSKIKKILMQHVGYR